ncbi:phosphate ABC transporter permease PstA [Salinirubrum litoreum]|uniref:Phosphate transport system permease protein PstA n=1 Tax=Salinirubrum litoreum TaxID=1126234 RepID=A0ABD5RA90_9EURY|nr:phosphate ABC transporter permease PstA [Salinirubrum litoreum]
MATRTSPADETETGTGTVRSGADWQAGEHVRRWPGRLFAALTAGATALGLALLGVLLLLVTLDAFAVFRPEPAWLDFGFLTSAPSRFPDRAGIYPALLGSIYMALLLSVLTFPIGVGAAIYLEEYARESRLTRLIQLNIANLAGVPSVVYGILGLALFVRTLSLPNGSLLVGAATVGLLVLPIVVISAQEAIRAVPDSLRQASYGMGATRWQTVRRVVLPQAFPGILTGTILALGRAIGETAPLIMIGAPATLFLAPSGVLEKFSAMPRQIFAWSDAPQPEFQYGVVAAGVVVLVSVLLVMNATAIYLRYRTQR